MKSDPAVASLRFGRAGTTGNQREDSNARGKSKHDGRLLSDEGVTHWNAAPIPTLQGLDSAQNTRVRGQRPVSVGRPLASASTWPLLIGLVT